MPHSRDTRRGCARHLPLCSLDDARLAGPYVQPGHLMRRTLLTFTVLLVACAGRQAPPAAPDPAPAPAAAPAPAVPETVVVRDPDMQRELTRLRMLLLERSAQLDETQHRLDEATTEVVRTMARSRSLATRAEAASAIAEAEVTLQQLRARAQQAPVETRQAEDALHNASAAFDAENYGGAVYLATQAKRAATAGRGRVAESGATASAGERTFAVPVQLTTTARVNLRSGPGGNAGLVATVPAGTALTGYAFLQDWVRVTTADGRGAWVHQSLVRGAAAGGP